MAQPMSVDEREAKEAEEFRTGPLSVLTTSVKTNSQVRPAQQLLSESMLLQCQIMFWLARVKVDCGTVSRRFRYFCDAEVCHTTVAGSLDDPASNWSSEQPISTESD